jgi:hypothetical protein
MALIYKKEYLAKKSKLKPVLIALLVFCMLASTLYYNITHIRVDYKSEFNGKVEALDSDKYLNANIKVNGIKYYLINYITRVRNRNISSYCLIQLGDSIIKKKNDSFILLIKKTTGVKMRLTRKSFATNGCLNCYDQLPVVNN